MNGLLIQWGRSRVDTVTLIAYTSIDTYCVVSGLEENQANAPYKRDFWQRISANQIMKTNRNSNSSFLVDYITIGY